ncbi:MAG: anthranilate phosphoribosyltransferase [Cyclobacteriaceae bacterium]|nr:MAG: anthranilate phosphoribosyltransferase [Cyclobacteriaceae bacterium]
MKEILNHLTAYKSLDRELAKEVLINLANGAYNNSQIAAFLTVFTMRSVTVEELSGFKDAMLELCIRLPLDDYDVIDLCGTGGDSKDSFNISTLSSFVVAGAGQNVAKHGNYGVSSVCGSSNLMTYFGYEFTNERDRLLRDLDSAGICFLHAPLFHPAMKNVAPIRKELGVKTFFNMLGPMVNPSQPKNQLVGVFSLELARIYGYIYQQTDKQYSVVHSMDGYDEVSLTGPFKWISNNQESLVHPADIGMSLLQPEQLAGGATIKESADIFWNVLNAKGTEAQNQVVVANSALALQCAGPELSFSTALDKARESLMQGKALLSFKKLIGEKITNI